MGMVRVLIEDKWIVTLFPFFISSNWFYVYQGNDFNAGNFTLRTRFFNALWGNLFNMLGAWIMGSLMAFMPKKFSRCFRARGGLIFLFCYTMFIWGCGWTFARGTDRSAKVVPIDL